MIGPSEPPHPPRRIHTSQDPFPLSTNPTAFSTLSTVAMDELYTLEREEAMRRAEYEARHAEALRRATQREAHQPNRVSKSATASPTSTPIRTNIALSSISSGDGGYFGTSSERDGHMGEDEYIKPKDAIKRRMSGPAWQMTPMSREPPLGHPHTSGHVVDSHIQGGRGQAHRGHPYQSSPHPMAHPHSHQYRHLTRQDDTPSPKSSDSDSLPSQNTIHSPSGVFPTQPHSMHTFGSSESSARSAEFAFTPSTSPFLGPLRTLNIHSANPSRAPSPILLPPASMGGSVAGDGSISPIDDSYKARSRGTSVVGSPPGSGFARATVRRKSAGDDRPPHQLFALTQSHTFPGQLSQLSDRSLHTPQLSSGPSSDGSSPGSLSYPLGTPSATMAFHFEPGSGTPSAANSRPSSPSHWQQPSSSHSSTYGRESALGGGTHGPAHHHHLAHSVRKAFGMTPIHPQNQPPRNTSRPSSQSAQTQSGASTPAYPNIYSSSMPSSRSGSPPITLPPLKMPSARSSPSQRSPRGNNRGLDDDVALAGVDRRNHPVERLPGFSEFEAASCALGPGMGSR